MAGQLTEDDTVLDCILHCSSVSGLTKRLSKKPYIARKQIGKCNRNDTNEQRPKQNIRMNSAKCNWFWIPSPRNHGTDKENEDHGTVYRRHNNENIWHKICRCVYVWSGVSSIVIGPIGLNDSNTTIDLTRFNKIAIQGTPQMAVD